MKSLKLGAYLIIKVFKSNDENIIRKHYKFVFTYIILWFNSLQKKMNNKLNMHPLSRKEATLI